MRIRLPIAAIALMAAPLLAQANPALTGSWSGAVDGQPLAVTFDGKGGGRVDGRSIRYQVNGNVLVVEDQGQLAMYQFQVRGNQLLVAGGQLPGTVTLQRGTAAATAVTPAPRSAGSPADLVGKWCKSSNFNANVGGSSSSACFELRADGSYVYGSERSSSGAWGGTSGSSGDSGRWSATPTSITAQSRSGKVNTYQLQKRNHPKNRDPMLCLDGECYVTYWRKNPW